MNARELRKDGGATLLVIDTSTSFGAVGLWRDGGLTRSLAWKSRNNHTAELLPSVDSLLRADGAAPADLDGVVVTVGPGGFSAVRTGLGVAKGLALGAALPLAGVSSLEASAFPYREASERVCAALPAGRGAVAWAAFGADGGAWGALTGETVAPIDEFLGAQPAGTLFCGEAVALLDDSFREHFGGRLRAVTASAPLDRLNGAGELGAAALASGRQGTVASVEPRYLRPPHITRSAKNTPPPAAGR